MSLYNKLGALRIKYAKILKPGLAAKMDAHIEHLRASGAMEKIVKVGDRAPSFDLIDGKGEQVRSDELLTDGPLVISFYRGSWCPYCVEEISALNESFENLAQAGGRLVVISPQAAPHTEKQQRELNLKYSLLVDHDNGVAKKFGLVYSFPEDLKNLYLNTFKNDLEKHNGTHGIWELPIPARIVIDSDGIVRDVKADPDYRFRPEPEDSIRIVESLRKSSTPEMI